MTKPAWLELCHLVSPNCSFSSLATLTPKEIANPAAACGHLVPVSSLVRYANRLLLIVSEQASTLGCILLGC